MAIPPKPRIIRVVTSKQIKGAARRSKPLQKSTIPLALAPSTPPPPCNHLLTEPQMIQKLASMVEADSLTGVAEEYKIKASQLSDCLYGRANLSKKMLAKLNFRLHKFYESLGKGSA